MWWHPPTEHTPDGEGFWSVATHAETLEVLRDAATYSSERGGDRPYGGTLIQDLPVAGQVLNMMDDPRHARIRRLVTSGLTPKMIRRIEDDLRRRCRTLLDAVEVGVPFDFVRRRGRRAPDADDLHAPGCSRVRPALALRGGRARLRLPGFAQVLRDRRRLCGDPRAHDRLRARAHRREAPPPGRRHALHRRPRHPRRRRPAAADRRRAVHVLLAALQRRLRDHPQRRRRRGARAVRATRPVRAACAPTPACSPTAVEETIRWTTPSPSKRRTATRTHGAAAARPSRRATRWWCGRGRPTATSSSSTAADRFDIARDPNPHVGFGHGAALLPRGQPGPAGDRGSCSRSCSPGSGEIRVVSPVEWTRSNRHTGIRHLVVEVDRAER